MSLDSFGVYIWGFSPWLWIFQSITKQKACVCLTRCIISKVYWRYICLPGVSCWTTPCLTQTWATVRACQTWWLLFWPRSRMRATRSGASWVSWRTPSSSALLEMRIWRGSWWGCLTWCKCRVNVVICYSCVYVCPDVPAWAPAADAASLPPASDPAGWGRPSAAVLPPLGSSVFQAWVPWRWSPAHVGGLLGTLSGTARYQVKSGASAWGICSPDMTRVLIKMHIY